MQWNSCGSFILNGQMPQSFSPIIPCCRTPWFRQLPRYTHFISHYVFSSSPESIVLSLPSRSQPFHLFRSHLRGAARSSLFFLSHFFFLLHLSLFLISLFHLWPFLFNGSLIYPALTLLSSPKLFLVSPLSLVWPFSLISFFAPTSCLLQNIKKSTPLVVSLYLCLPSASVALSPSPMCSLSSPQIILLGHLPGYTKLSPARWHLEIKRLACATESICVCICTCLGHDKNFKDI